MKLKESIQKTKMFFHNTLQNLKSLFFEGYQKIPKPASLNPFSCAKLRERDQYYTDFCNDWECDLELAMKKKKKSTSITLSKEVAREENECNGISMKLPISPLKNKEEVVIIKEENKSKKSLYSRKGGEEQSSKKKKDEGGYVLAKKMKELEMMDASDVEHVLDVEEALHYYNRLKSPVYLDIVDTFFTDMYREFSVPQPSASINSSKRRLGSIRL